MLSIMSSKKLADLRDHVRSEELLTLAVTHRSYCAEHDQVASNERLEFLGDAVLGCAIAAHLYERFPEMSEGQLSKMRAEVVNTSSLAEVAAELGLGDELRLGRGELISGGRCKQSILADALEAVIAAIFLHDGLDRARSFVIEIMADRIELAAAGPGATDHKSRLQELAAQLDRPAPAYHVESSGPDHDKRFTASVSFDDEVIGGGVGGSKKQAEQMAAERACETFEQANDESETEGADA
jgi:ribonuclease-3